MVAVLQAALKRCTEGQGQKVLGEPHSLQALVEAMTKTQAFKTHRQVYTFQALIEAAAKHQTWRFSAAIQEKCLSSSIIPVLGLDNT